MAFPVTPLDAVFELYAGNDWQDITGDVYLRDVVTTTRGRANEAPTAEPGTCSLTLNNRHGKYSPRNPTSPYFGALGRNAGMRVSIKDNEDDFARTEPSGWGTTAAGDAWSTTGIGAPSTSVTADRGRHTINTTGSYVLSYLPGRLYRDVDVAVTCRAVTSTTPVGANFEPCNIALRGESVTDYFLVRVSVEPGAFSPMTIEIRHENSSTMIAGPVDVPRLTGSSTSEFRVRAQIEGQTIRAKVWDPTTVPVAWDPNIGPYEPADWDVVGHTGDTFEGQQGWVGIRTGVAAGVSSPVPPITWDYDNLVVSIPRFSGEVSDWPVKWDVSGKDVYVPIQANGALRRLGQGSPPLRSAIFRAITNSTATTPLAYWPCEDGQDAEFMANARPGGEPLRFAGGPLSMVQRASYSGFACSDPLPTFGGPFGAYMVGKVPATTSTGYVHAAMLAAIPEAGVSVDCQILTVRVWGGRVGELMVEALTDGSLRVRVRDWLGNDIHVGSPIGFDVNGKRAFVALTAHDVASTITWTLEVYKAGFGAAGTTSDVVAGLWTLGRPATVAVGLGGTTNGSAFGHVMVSSGPTKPLDTIPWASINAYAGPFPETHAARMVRLTTEEAVPFAYYGDTGDTEMAGVQRPMTVVDTLREGAVTDQGLLGECRGSTQLHYRTRRSMYNQTGLALDYTAGHISPPFEPVDDDQQTRNDITVKRTGGSSVQVTKELGSMSTSPPPVGVGRYDTSVDVSLNSDEQLPDNAGWRLGLGTVDEARYPSVRVDLAKNPALIRDVTSLSDGDRITVANLPAWMPPDLVDLIVVGYTERISSKSWDVTFNCLPGSPYQVIVLNNSTARVGSQWKLDRVAAAYAVLSTTATSFVGRADVLGGASFSGSAIFDQWTTAGGQMPIPIMLGGELMNITAISASGLDGCTFTVTRSVNGVVKTHRHGTPFRLAKRQVIPL